MIPLFVDIRLKCVKYVVDNIYVFFTKRGIVVEKT